MGRTAATRVFISYRRADTGDVAGRLRDALARRVGDANVFMDVQSMAAGVDFRQVIAEEVGRCDVLVALIGRGWLTSTEESGGRRIDDPEDLLRLEIRSALDRGIRVIPVLVNGAAALRKEDVPTDLAPLVRRNAVRLDSETFATDVLPIIGGIGGSRRRWPLLLGALALVVALVVVTVIVLTGQGPGPGPTADADSTTVAGAPSSAPTSAPPSGRAEIRAEYDRPGGCSATYTVTGDVNGDPRVSSASALWVVAVLTADPNVLYYPKGRATVENGRITVVIQANTESGVRRGRFGLVVSPNAAADADLQLSMDSDAERDDRYSDTRRLRLQAGNVEIATTPFVEQRC